MNAAEIKSRLCDRAQEVCEMLLPAGKRTGGEWCAGSINGEAGNSLKVHLSGHKAGVWQDFAGDAKGDILDLWMAVRNVQFLDAFKQAKEWLGVPDETREFFRPALHRPHKIYSKPISGSIEPICSGGVCSDYLMKSRGLEFKGMALYRVSQFHHIKFGPTIVFPCYDPEGKEIDLLKFLAVERRDGKKQVWASPDSKPRLFGWQAIDRNKREVHITEGEIDCLTLGGLDFNALSLPQGCKNMEWIEHDFEALEPFERIYIWTDMDEPGRKAACEMAQRLGRERCFRVELPAPYKDANEALIVGKFLDADFQECVDRAKTLDPGELRGIAEFADDGWEELHPTKTETIGTEIPVNLPWRCRFGEVTVWSGFNAHGKTLMLNNFVVHDAAQGQRCCIASLEMPARELLATYVKIALGGHPPKERRDRYDAAVEWLREKVWIVNKVGVMHWQKVIPLLEYAAKRYGCTRFVVDSLVRLGIGEDDYDMQKEAVGAFVEFAGKFGHVHLVCHPRKMESEKNAPGKLDVRGSGTISDLIHNGFTVWRNKAKEQGLEELTNGKDDETKRAALQKQMDAQLMLWKHRKLGHEPFRSLWFHQPSGQFLNAYNAQPRIYVREPEMRQAELVEEEGVSTPSA